jgi:hypothetical protein
MYHLFAYFFGLFILLLFFIFFDYLSTSIIFIFTGSFDSVLQLGLEFSDSTWNYFFSSSNYTLDTPLDGFDILINSFLELQYSVLGRWKMLGISLLIGIPCLVLGIVIWKIFDIEPTEKMMTALFIPIALSLLTIAPIWAGFFMGIMRILTNWLGLQ